MYVDSTDWSAVAKCWCDARFLSDTEKGALDQLWWHAEHSECLTNTRRENLKRKYRKKGHPLPDFADMASEDRPKQPKRAAYRKRIKFVHPTGGRGEVIQPFGANSRAYGQLGLRGHNGLDMGVVAGTPVVAAYSGTVQFQGQGVNNMLMGASAGLCVVLSHKEGSAHFYTGYAHLSRAYVADGAAVKAGDVIGLSGASGMTTGDHLHFELIPVGNALALDNGYLGRIDPAPYLTDKGALFPTKGGATESKGGAQ